MTTNIAASVRARLANQARDTRRPFQELLQYYGLERFLYRLSRTAHRDRFVLKGALMLRVWNAPASRPTRDIDLLGHIDNELSTLEGVARDVCDIEVDDDGVRFDAATVSGQRIKEDADYEGVRVKLIGFLENARIPIQIDIAFGDVMHPAADERQTRSPRDALVNRKARLPAPPLHNDDETLDPGRGEHDDGHHAMAPTVAGLRDRVWKQQ